MGNKVVCKECGGAKGVYEPRSGVWLSVCDYCGGEGEIEIYPDLNETPAQPEGMGMAFRHSGEKQITPIQTLLRQERERAEKLKKVLYSVKDCLETLRFDIEEENPIDWFTLVHIRQELAKIKRVLE